MEEAPDGQPIYTVAETDWRNIRNNDFNIFYTYVKSLPDISVPDENDEDDEDGVNIYDPNAVLEEASTLQRNLLGKLTDFEKAFNYFKYKFPAMAFFSAFIAVFFDLGAFLTGCFLYITEYFETDKN